MGFIPIFITLGGFVFLFMMVVHQHFKGKKRLYFRILGEIEALLFPGKNVDAAHPNLKGLEQHLLALRETGQSTPPEDLQRAGMLIKEAKLLRHQYQELRNTKPYSFVAQLLGHSAI
ncbi:hypothetical protein [Pleomorphovibrio marinus]|uniref:hypothetical protein n=1 Tax=Pleomorphovibrio marinus TaxID=2164132 RepID=UPI000E0C04B9|nr:hypothetical protein [Pleomorphovibrio marinus]